MQLRAIKKIQIKNHRNAPEKFSIGHKYRMTDTVSSYYRDLQKKLEYDYMLRSFIPLHIWFRIYKSRRKTFMPKCWEYGHCFSSVKYSNYNPIYPYQIRRPYLIVWSFLSVKWTVPRWTHVLILFSGSVAAFYLNSMPVNDEFLNSLMELPKYPTLNSMMYRRSAASDRAEMLAWGARRFGEKF